MENSNKTVFSFRLTSEQKELLQAYQKEFNSQTEFVAHLLACLENKGKQPMEDNLNELILCPSPLEMALLQYVAQRESTEKETVLPEHVYSYVFNVMLVKGDKFHIDSIPDSVINRLRKEFSHD